MAAALEDLTYILYFLSRESAAGKRQGASYVLVDRTWMAAYCRTCCAAFGYPCQITIVGTRPALEQVVHALGARESATIIASKILYLKYSSVLQSLKERGALIVA